MQRHLLKRALIAGLVLSSSALGLFPPESLAQSSIPGHVPPAAPEPPPQISIPQTPPPVHIPIVPVVPVIPIPVRVPQTPVLPLNPRDVVSPPITTIHENPTPDVAKGVEAIADGKFIERVSQNAEGIVVRARPGSDFTKVNSCAVGLRAGELMVSVRRPTKMGILNCDIADVTVDADADVIFSYNDGVVRIGNLTGCGESVKVRIKGADDNTPHTVCVKPGYEFVYSPDKKLTSRDLKVADGIARRNFCILERGHGAVVEFSVESVLQNCDLIAQVEQESHGSLEKRILTDMSKMAAVLNYINGSSGYTSAGQVKLEVQSNLLLPQK